MFRTVVDEAQTTRDSLINNPYVVAQSREYLAVLAPTQAKALRPRSPLLPGLGRGRRSGKGR